MVIKKIRNLAKPSPYSYLIALGANLGSREDTLRQALKHLENHVGQVVRVSCFHHTEPVGVADKEFVNAACLLVTDQDPAQLMQTLLAIEKLFGRERLVQGANRPLDLDIILAKQGELDLTIRGAVEIPHPRAITRSFVMLPAAEICPDWVFPGSGQTIALIAKKWQQDEI